MHVVLSMDQAAPGPLHELFAQAPWGQDCWSESNLRSCMFYLRRSKYVELPAQFAELIPHSEDEMLK